MTAIPVRSGHFLNGASMIFAGRVKPARCSSDLTHHKANMKKIIGLVALNQNPFEMFPLAMEQNARVNPHPGQSSPVRFLNRQIVTVGRSGGA